MNMPDVVYLCDLCHLARVWDVVNGGTGPGKLVTSAEGALWE